jgi:hypothetical protein
MLISSLVEFLSRRDTSSQRVGMLIKENDSMLVLTVDSFIVPYSILGEKTTFMLGSHAWYIFIIHSTEPMMLKPKLMLKPKNIEFTC